VKGRRHDNNFVDEACKSRDACTEGGALSAVTKWLKPAYDSFMKTNGCAPVSDLTLVTFDWVPEPPRGFVRDIRLRWALEEAGLPHRVKSVPFRDRGAEHFSHQPFGQVPWLTHGDISIFESGAILLYLGEMSEKLMPADPRSRIEVKEWVFAALASVEAASQPWSFFHFMGHTGDAPMWKFFDDWVNFRLKHMEAVLTAREWLVGNFSVAAILIGGCVAPYRPIRRSCRLSRLSHLPRARHGSTFFRQSTCRPDGAFCCSGLRGAVGKWRALVVSVHKSRFLHGPTTFAFAKVFRCKI
jgi:glutathione S-transferase